MVGLSVSNPFLHPTWPLHIRECLQVFNIYKMSKYLARYDDLLFSVLVHYCITWALVECQFQRIWYFTESSAVQMSDHIRSFKKSWFVTTGRTSLGDQSWKESNLSMVNTFVTILAEHSSYVIDIIKIYPTFFHNCSTFFFQLVNYSLKYSVSCKQSSPAYTNWTAPCEVSAVTGTYLPQTQAI